VTSALPPAHSSRADIERTPTGLVHRIKGWNWINVNFA
jgi:hypothetical protein